MPTTVSSLARTFRSVCYALAFLAMLGLILLVPSVAAQSAPDPMTGMHAPGHDHSMAGTAVQTVSSARFTPSAFGNTRLTGANEIGGGDPDGAGTAQVQIDIG